MEYGELKICHPRVAHVAIKYSPPEMTSVVTHGATPLSSLFTCNTCQIRFASAELQRQHMKTEWHRYNLKRRVALLPSITSDVFAEKILSQKHYTPDERPMNEDEYGFFVHSRRSGPGLPQVTKKMLKKMRHKNRGHSDTDREAWVRIVPRPSSPTASIASRISQFSLGNSDDLRLVNTQEDSEFLDTDSEYTDLEPSISHASTPSDVVLEYEIIDGNDQPQELVSDEEELFDATISCAYCGKHHTNVESNVRHMFREHGLYIPERSFLTNLTGLLTHLGEVLLVSQECIVCGFKGLSIESTRLHILSKGHARIPYESKEEKAALAEFYTFYTEKAKPTVKGRKSVAFAKQSSSELSDSDLEDEAEDMATEDINNNYTLAKIDHTRSELILPNGPRLGHRTNARNYRANAPFAVAASARTMALVDDRRFASGLTRHEVTRQEKKAWRHERYAVNAEIRSLKTRKVNFQQHFRDEILGT